MFDLWDSQKTITTWGQWPNEQCTNNSCLRSPLFTISQSTYWSDKQMLCLSKHCPHLAVICHASIFRWTCANRWKAYRVWRIFLHLTSLHWHPRGACFQSHWQSRNTHFFIRVHSMWYPSIQVWMEDSRALNPDLSPPLKGSWFTALKKTQKQYYNNLWQF